MTATVLRKLFVSVAVFSLTYALAAAIVIIGANLSHGFDKSQLGLVLAMLLVFAAYSSAFGAAMGAVTGLIYAMLPSVARDARTATALGIGLLAITSVVFRTEFGRPVELSWLVAGVIAVTVASVASTWLLARLGR